MNEGDSISDHLSRFETSFSHIFSRCSESSRQEAIALKNFLSVEEVKIMCLFRSLPSSLSNIVDNLSTKDHLTYSIVNKRLLDLQQNRHSSDNSSTAYAARRPTGNNNWNRPKNFDKVLECTWCRKYGEDYVGHVHTRCAKLKKYLEQKSMKKGKQASRDSEKAHSVSGPPIIPSEDPNMTDLSENKAFLSSPTTSLSNWILDSGCTSHMTSRKDLLTSIKPHGGVVTLANGGQVRVQAAGSIRLDLRISTGDVIPATIHDVLYVPELKGGNLISESQLELNGCKIISENGRRKVFTGGKV
ncbi:hypothetical protein K3495_g15363 [Podosphaera aphanis]|nr:hypothetical protein K3495_g15363 [Podosphaera aphanis]